MKKGVLGVLITLILAIVISSFIIFPKTGFAIKPINKVTLESLRQKAEVVCLQNSQCLEGSECVNNACVNKNEIDICQEISLSTPTRKIKNGDSINSVKKILTGEELPYLLSRGELVEIVNNKTIEYLYSPVILIGDNKIEKENQEYQVSIDEPIYTYRLTFSKGVDFSNKNIRRQSLRILGNEYIIGSNSDNSNIYLVSDKKNILLQNKNNIKIIQNEKKNIMSIEIIFFSWDNIKVSNYFIEPTFNSIKLSFNNADDYFADVRVGGVC